MFNLLKNTFNPSTLSVWLCFIVINLISIIYFRDLSRAVIWLAGTFILGGFIQLVVIFLPNKHITIENFWNELETLDNEKIKRMWQRIERNKRDYLWLKKSKFPNKGDTALHFAVNNNLFDTVQLFLAEDEKYIFPFKNEDEKTILHCAVDQQNTKIIEILLTQYEKEYFVRPDKFGNTLLHSVTRSQNLEIFEMLLPVFSSCLLDSDSKNRTILQLACKYQNLEFINLILNNKKDSLQFYRQDDKLNNCLHYAILYGDEKLFDIFETLIQSKPCRLIHSVILQQKNKDNKTPLDCCKNSQIRTQLEKLLPNPNPNTFH